MNLEINKWYGFANIIFIVKEKLDRHPYASSFGRHPDGAIKIHWFQRVDHFNEMHVRFDLLFEVYEDERYIYNDDSEERIDFKELKPADSYDMKLKLMGLFLYPIKETR